MRTPSRISVRNNTEAQDEFFCELFELSTDPIQPTTHTTVRLLASGSGGVGSGFGPLARVAFAVTLPVDLNTLGPQVFIPFEEVLDLGALPAGTYSVGIDILINEGSTAGRRVECSPWSFDVVQAEEVAALGPPAVVGLVVLLSVAGALLLRRSV